MAKITDETYYNLSVKETLIVEVLIARHRLGEVVWTFDERVHEQLNSLSDKGLVNWKHGVIGGTCLAWLSDLGKAVYLSSPYISHDTNEVVKAATQALNQITVEAATLKTTINKNIKRNKGK